MSATRGAPGPAPRDVEVLILSLTDAPASLRSVRRYLPHARVFRATDYRNTVPEELYREGKVTVGAIDTLKRGRKWHKELPKASAVGLFDSHLRAVQEEPEAPYLLICEEDCVLREGFVAKLRELLGGGLEFDVAIFGPNIHGETIPVRGHPGWCRIRGMTYFWHTHCVLYSPSGRARAGDLLHYPIDAQLDSIISIHAQQIYHAPWTQTTDTPDQPRPVASEREPAQGIDR